jgi:hypothetical protein
MSYYSSGFGFPEHRCAEPTLIWSSSNLAKPVIQWRSWRTKFSTFSDCRGSFAVYAAYDSEVKKIPENHRSLASFVNICWWVKLNHIFKAISHLDLKVTIAGNSRGKVHDGPRSGDRATYSLKHRTLMSGEVYRRLNFYGRLKLVIET